MSMTPDDAMAILAQVREMRQQINRLIMERDYYLDKATDLRAEIADITAERDALRAELDEALCINDQQQEAAEARRYGRSLP